MRNTLAVRISLALACIAAVAGGCSSAPVHDESDQTKEDLNLGGGTIAINYCKQLPLLKAGSIAISIPGESYAPYVPDCYHHVQGYEISVPARVTTCSAFAVPGIGFWLPNSYTPQYTSGQAVPAWTGSAGSHVCSYTFNGLLNGSWQAPYATGNSEGVEEALALDLCSALDAAGIAYTAVKYILPSEPEDLSGGASYGVIIGANGVPMPDLSHLFRDRFCYGVVGGCGSCTRQ